MFLKKLVIISLFMFFFVPSRLYAGEDFKKYIVGQAVNKTGDYKVPELRIVLVTKDGVVFKEAYTDKDGKFSLGPVDLSADSYLITKYKGVSYQNKPLKWNKFLKKWDESSFDLYDPTTDTKNVLINWYTVTMKTVSLKGEKMFYVDEAILLLNKGSSIYIGKDAAHHNKMIMEVIKINLPPGYTNLKFKRGFNKRSSFAKGSYLYHTKPVKPGAKWFNFTYNLPFRVPDYSLSVKPFLFTRHFRFKFMSIGAKVETNLLKFSYVMKTIKEGKKNIKKDHINYLLFEGKLIDDGEEIKINIFNLKKDYKTGKIIVLFFVVALFVMVVVRLRKLTYFVTIQHINTKFPS